MGKATKELHSDYTSEDFTNIYQHGCVSGAASYHIYYNQTSEFYDRHEGEILDSLELWTGVNPLTKFSGDIENITQLKNRLVWNFIELVSAEYADS